MPEYSKEYCIEIRGDYACFSRSELSVDRVSYEVITPSAARNIFQSIFLVKGAIDWCITRIEVLNDIKWTRFKVNEVAHVVKTRNQSPIFIEDHRTQRRNFILKDVAYRIYARMVFYPIEERTESDKKIAIEKLTRKGVEDENMGKYIGQLERRLEVGGCFAQPYLGCRQYHCDYEWIEKPIRQNGIPVTRDLGIMLFGFNFFDKENAGRKRKDYLRPMPLYYHAKMVNGVIEVPNINSIEIIR